MANSNIYSGNAERHGTSERADRYGNPPSVSHRRNHATRREKSARLYFVDLCGTSLKFGDVATAEGSASLTESVCRGLRREESYI